MSIEGFHGKQGTTRPRVTQRVERVDDMMKAGFTFAINTDSFNVEFRTENSSGLPLGITQKLLRGYMDPEFAFLRNEEALDILLKRNNFAFISAYDMYEKLNKNWTHSRKCETMAQQPYPEDTPNAMFTKKGSPYLKSIKYAMTRMGDSGVLRRNYLILKRYKDDYAPLCREDPPLRPLELSSKHLNATSFNVMRNIKN